MGEIKLKNGSLIKLFSGDEPERLRGPQHHGAWIDELAAFRYPEAYDQLMFGLRLGNHPQVVVTTTPKPKPLIKSLVSREDGSVIITKGNTFENQDNLARSALAELQVRYGGTRIGRQELYGEILDDVEGALWLQSTIDINRHTEPSSGLIRTVVGIDPAVTNNADSDETGIVVAGKNGQGEAWVLADVSCKASPLEWAKKAVNAYYEYGADAIVAEVNNGGDMIPTIIGQIDPSVRVKSVRATKGKRLRAEPIAAYYEQNRVHHVGTFTQLENQMTTWTPDDSDSPDRLDALVWALTELLPTSSLLGYLSNLAVWCDNCNLPMPKTIGVCSNCGNVLIESTNQETLGV